MGRGEIGGAGCLAFRQAQGERLGVDLRRDRGERLGTACRYALGERGAVVCPSYLQIGSRHLRLQAASRSLNRMPGYDRRAGGAKFMAANQDARSRFVRGKRRALLLGKQAWQRMGRRPRTRQFVFVAGMQRSGTNMVMDVLERSFRTDVYHETDPRAFHRFEMRPEPVIQQLAARSHAPAFVIKALCELDLLPKLMESFAPARTLWVLRSADDVVNSATRSFRNFPAQIARLVRDRNSNQWRGRGMSDETHGRLAALYHEGMNEPTAAALTWYYRNILFFENGFDQDDRLLLVSYENLVTEPSVEFKRIFRFLEIPYSPWISRIVFASSVQRRPPPSIEPGVRDLCSDLTQRFQICLERSNK